MQNIFFFKPLLIFGHNSIDSNSHPHNYKADVSSTGQGRICWEYLF